MPNREFPRSALTLPDGVTVAADKKTAPPFRPHYGKGPPGGSPFLVKNEIRLWWLSQ
jgi:hypothetical protein